MENQSISITTTSPHPGTVRVLLEGQLVIKNAKNIKKELSAALSGSQHIILALKNIVRIDLAVAQLLIALQKSVARPEKSLSFDIELNDDIKSVMTHAGLGSLLITNFQNQE